MEFLHIKIALSDIRLKETAALLIGQVTVWGSGLWYQLENGYMNNGSIIVSLQPASNVI